MDGTVNALSVIRLEDKRIECTHRSDCGIRAEVAQLVEHSAVNRGVIGSSPILLVVRIGVVNKTARVLRYPL